MKGICRVLEWFSTLGARVGGIVGGVVAVLVRVLGGAGEGESL